MLSFLAGGVVLLALAGGAGLGCVSGTPRAADLRAADGHLAPCSSSPNCVCSEAVAAAKGAAADGDHAAAAADPGHAVAPFSFSGPAPTAWAALLAVLAGQPRVKLVLQTPDYLHAEFTSLVFRFVDDVEFRLDAAAGLIHVRSASRVGYSDLGANRSRVESLREAFARQLALGIPAGG